MAFAWTGPLGGVTMGNRVLLNQVRQPDCDHGWTPTEIMAGHRLNSSS